MFTRSKPSMQRVYGPSLTIYRLVTAVSRGKVFSRDFVSRLSVDISRRRGAGWREA